MRDCLACGSANPSSNYRCDRCGASLSGTIPYSAATRSTQDRQEEREARQEEQPRNIEPAARWWEHMGSWHPGKIAVVWVVALLSYFFFYDLLDFTRSEARAGGFVAVVVAGIVTWRWLSARET